MPKLCRSVPSISVSSLPRQYLVFPLPWLQHPSFATRGHLEPIITNMNYPSFPVFTAYTLLTRFLSSNQSFFFCGSLFFQCQFLRGMCKQLMLCVLKSKTILQTLCLPQHQASISFIRKAKRDIKESMCETETDVYPRYTT